MKNHSLVGVFTAASVVGIAHYVITGATDPTASLYVGIHAGWGAVAIDAIRAIRNRGTNTSSKGDGTSPKGPNLGHHHP